MNNKQTISAITGGLVAAVTTLGAPNIDAQEVHRFGGLTITKDRECVERTKTRHYMSSEPRTIKVPRIVMEERTVNVPKCQSYDVTVIDTKTNCDFSYDPCNDPVLQGGKALLEGAGGLLCGAFQGLGCLTEGAVHHAGAKLENIGTGIRLHTSGLNDCLKTKCYDAMPTYGSACGPTVQYSTTDSCCGRGYSMEAPSVSTPGPTPAPKFNPGPAVSPKDSLYSTDPTGPNIGP